MHVSRKFSFSVFLSLLMLGVFGCSLGTVTYALGGATLSVNPIFYQASFLGQTVPIQVYVFAVSNVTGYQFQLGFNTTQLQCLNATVGNWFPSPPNSTSTVTVDNTHGKITIQAYLQSGTSPLSLFGTLHGTLLVANFNAVYAPPYPQHDNSSPLTITNDALYGIGNQTIAHAVQNGLYVTPYAQPQLGLTLNTDRKSYFYEDKINVNGTFTGNGSPIPDGLVALEIQAPSGLPIVARTYRLSNTSMICPMQITSLTPCDIDGNPKSSFAVGSFAYFNVAVMNTYQSTLNAFVLVNPYDSGNTSLGVSSFMTLINPGYTNTIKFEFWLPYNVDPRVLTPPTSGNATVYASVWSNPLPNGGIPIALEASANFTITGTAQGTPTFSNPPSDGTYQAMNWSLHFKKGDYSLSQPPNYNITVAALYMGSAWLQNIAQSNSTQIQITIAGDINKNGQVNLQDLSLLAKAYNTKPGDAKWNPAADINGDGKVGLSDLSLLAKNYGKGVV